MPGRGCVSRYNWEWFWVPGSPVVVSFIALRGSVVLDELLEELDDSVWTGDESGRWVRRWLFDVRWTARACLLGRKTTRPRRPELSLTERGARMLVRGGTLLEAKLDDIASIMRCTSYAIPRYLGGKKRRKRQSWLWNHDTMNWWWRWRWRWGEIAELWGPKNPFGELSIWKVLYGRDLLPFGHGLCKRKDLMSFIWCPWFRVIHRLQVGVVPSVRGIQ